MYIWWKNQMKKHASLFSYTKTFLLSLQSAYFLTSLTS